MSATDVASVSKTAEQIRLNHHDAGLEFVFAPDVPRLICVRTAGGAALMGDEVESEPLFEICHIGQETLWSGLAHPEITAQYRLVREGQTLRYVGQISWAGELAVELEIYFTLRGAELEMGYRQVRESKGYQLLAVRLPAVATVLSCQSGSRLVAPVNGGRLIDPVHCPDFETHGWPGWNWQAYATAAYHDRLGAVLEMPNIDDNFFMMVGETFQPVPVDLNPGSALQVRTQPSMGGYPTRMVRRAPGSVARKAAIWPVFAHRAPSPRPELCFVLHEQSSCRVTYLQAPDGKTLHWMDMARVLRSRLNFLPPKEHRNSYLYGVYCDIPGYSPEDRVSFDQVLEHVRKFHHLTDGIHQNPKLIGWQHKGHDTGYPDMSVVNEAIGGEQKLLNLIEKAKAYNATVACHDNYQCAYKHSPGWDEQIVCRDANGELQRAGIWAGGQQYIVHYYNYIVRTGKGLERVKKTYDRFPFAGTCYFDEMTVWLAKRDFNPACPASGQMALEGNRRLIEALRERGILLMSEGFTGPLAGCLSHGWLFQEGVYDRLTYGSSIPFCHAVYHGHATYGGDVGPKQELLVLQAFYNGRTISTHLGQGKDLNHLLAGYYLINAPYLLLREREVESVQQQGDRTRIEYGPELGTARRGPTYVEVDFSADRYEVVVEGRLVAKDYSSFVPGTKPGTYLAFSQRDAELVYPAPQGWADGSQLEAFTLTENGVGTSEPCTLEQGRVRLRVRAGVPVRISRKG